MKKVKSLSFILFLLLLISLSLYSCNTDNTEEINIGYIGPLSVRATDLGIAPSNAMVLAVEQYNANRLEGEPKVNLFIEDDKWNPENAIPAYKKLRKEHNISILFVSNTDATIRLQDHILKDRVILVNPLNNGELLSALNKNTFKIAKSTEQANGLVANRIVELGLKKIAILQFPNDYMSRATKEVTRILDKSEVTSKTIIVGANQTTFIEELSQLKEANYDAYVFFGYKEFGFAMKQARELGITAPFFGSTVLLDPEYYSNSEGAITGTIFPFFTPNDGNYILADEFLVKYVNTFGEKPASLWPPMQAYDAMNIILRQLKSINTTKDSNFSNVLFLVFQ